MTYTRVNWKDLPNTTTPFDATNFNIMDKGIYDNSVAIDQTDNNIGSLSNLNTQNKSSIINAINEVNDLINYLDYIQVGLSSQATISKNTTYGGVDIPFNDIIFQNNNSDFSITNNKVYYNGAKKALIQVNYNVLASIEGYLLTGSTNGNYKIVISLVDNGIAGNSANGSSLVLVEPGDYLSCQIGRASTFSNETVYTNTRLDAYVLTYLD